MAQLHDAKAETSAFAFDWVWLSQYLQPGSALHDNGTEFSTDYR